MIKKVNSQKESTKQGEGGGCWGVSMQSIKERGKKPTIKNNLYSVTLNVTTCDLKQHNEVSYNLNEYVRQ